MSIPKKTMRERANEMNAPTLPIMNSRTKGETESLLAVVVTVNDYDFMTKDGSEFAVFTISEEPEKFFFAGKVLTEILKDMDVNGCGEELRTDGLPLVLSKQKTKDGKRTFTAVALYPEK